MDPQSRPSGRCRLLELPAELRNEIYEYVLTHEHGVVFDDFDPIRISRGFQVGSGIGEQAGDMAPDELQYVCRQIRKETAALLFKYNKIVFRASPWNLRTTFPKKFFLRSLYACHVTKLVVYYSGSYYTGCLNIILRSLGISVYVRDNPAVIVVLRLSDALDIGWRSYGIDVGACILSEILRGVPLRIVPGLDPYRDLPFQRRPDQLPARQKPTVPENIRISLCHDSELDSCLYKWRQLIRNTGSAGRFSRVEIEGMLVLVKEMYENGI